MFIVRHSRDSDQINLDENEAFSPPTQTQSYVPSYRIGNRNQAPSPTICILYHYMKTKWKPVIETEENLVEMFERRPEKGRHVRHRKIMPNRNWCYFEEVSAKAPWADTEFLIGRGCMMIMRIDFILVGRGIIILSRRRWGILVHLDRRRLGRGLDLVGNEPLHRHHGSFCHHRQSKFLHMGRYHESSNGRLGRTRFQRQQLKAVD